MMSSKIPCDSEERKRLLQSFLHLPQDEKAVVYQALEHLRWLSILWGLEEVESTSLPSTSEKRHILFAYKALQILWFDELPDQHDQAFTVYVRDRLPEDETPETINKAFDRNTEELADLCKGMPRPNWLNSATEAKTSIESFPGTAQ
jgi:hypothetical protein